MKSEHKALTIIAVWFAAFAIMAIFFIDRDVTLGTGILAFVALAGASATTIEIAQSSAKELAQQQKIIKTEKAKNSKFARVDKLLAGLSDDDLAALRRRLVADEPASISDDGELVTLEEVLRGRQ
jgi:hypothetical protein